MKTPGEKCQAAPPPPMSLHVDDPDAPPGLVADLRRRAAHPDTADIAAFGWMLRGHGGRYTMRFIVQPGVCRQRPEANFVDTAELVLYGGRAPDDVSAGGHYGLTQDGLVCLTLDLDDAIQRHRDPPLERALRRFLAQLDDHDPATRDTTAAQAVLGMHDHPRVQSMLRRVTGQAEGPWRELRDQDANLILDASAGPTKLWTW